MGLNHGYTVIFQIVEDVNWSDPKVLILRLMHCLFEVCIKPKYLKYSGK